MVAQPDPPWWGQEQQLRVAVWEALDKAFGQAALEEAPEGGAVSILGDSQTHLGTATADLLCCFKVG